MRMLWWVVAIVMSLSMLAVTAQASSLQPIGSSFDQPTYVTSDPGDADRLFVVERKGKIKLVENGIVSTFADFSSEVECSSECKGERGLMSIALAPDFDSSGRLYLDYANSNSGTIYIKELTAEPGGKSATGPPRQLLAIPHPGQNNHNGGQLQFGPDGDLYISTGDGGGGNDEFHNSQDLTKPLGKILRIEPRPGELPPYTIPSDNPFASEASDYEPIWSYGLRNPFRFSFDSLTGDMVIGDVGQGEKEEVDYAPAPSGGRGANFGWNCREGSIEGPATDPGCSPPPLEGFTEPVFDYPHTPDPDVGGESRCAIIGGYVVRDPSLGALYGHYLYADLCSGAIRALQLPSVAGGHATDDCWIGLNVPSPVSFGEDAARRIYVVTEGGNVYRLAGPPSATCTSPPAMESTTRTRTTPFVGIKSQRRRIERGKAVLLTVWVSPCDKRKGQPVKLLRDGRPNGSKFFDRACTARFFSRVRHRTTFKAVVPENDKYSTAESRRLTIHIDHRRRH